MIVIIAFVSVGGFNAGDHTQATYRT